MTDIRELLDREAVRFDPGPDWIGPTLSQVRYRRRARMAITSVLSLLVAGAGLFLAIESFRGQRDVRPSAEEPPNYRFHTISLAPREDGEEGIEVSYAVSYEAYPGSTAVPGGRSGPTESWWDGTVACGGIGGRSPIRGPSWR
jgi:hypothetical protein